MGIMYRCSLGGGGETCEFIAPDYDANKTDYAADDVVLKDGKVMKYNGSEWEDFSLAECTTLNSNLGIIEIGTGQTFNIKEILPTRYSYLSVDDFLIVQTSNTVTISNSYTYGAPVSNTATSTFVKSYDANTGILTAYQQISCNLTSPVQDRGQASKNYDVTAYLKQ